MAKPIVNIVKPVLTEEEQNQKKIEQIKTEAAVNADGILDTIKLLQELHDSGILEAAKALLEAKEKVAKIAVGQLTRPPVTNAINNAMAVAEAASDLSPEMTKKLMASLSNGLQKAEEGLQRNEKIGLLDLMKVLNDPDINRALGFGINLLKGMGEGLKK
ncbi:DUF1641 domain-containing protein [Brevibacillus sp. TJ4]|uniref:DUF1641 domain-containing protein n=1 Tax=Brevibacillus sp. TJ4 TaxID=3234853 RepID=UPI0037D14C1D